MGLTKSSQDIQLWHIDIFSTMADGMTLNCDRKDNQSYMGVLFDS